MDNIHASCVSIDGQGVLLLGTSGLGKSDLCLRLICEYKAQLVADDRVDLNVSRETIYASAPQNIAGLLEVRGVGILQLPQIEQIPLKLAVNLIPINQEVERLPEPECWNYKEHKIPLINIHSQEASSPAKIIAALRWLKK